MFSFAADLLTQSSSVFQRFLFLRTPNQKSKTKHKFGKSSLIENSKLTGFCFLFCFVLFWFWFLASSSLDFDIIRHLNIETFEEHEETKFRNKIQTKKGAVKFKQTKF